MSSVVPVRPRLVTTSGLSCGWNDVRIGSRLPAMEPMAARVPSASTARTSSLKSRSRGSVPQSDQNPLAGGAPGWTATTSGRSTHNGIVRTRLSPATISTLSACESLPIAQPPTSNVVRSSAVPGAGLSR
jgi:hypothetical protein